MLGMMKASLVCKAVVVRAGGRRLMNWTRILRRAQRQADIDARHHTVRRQVTSMQGNRHAESLAVHPWDHGVETAMKQTAKTVNAYKCAR